MTGEKQRLDKWLWFARIVKSRTLAQKLIESGKVRVDGTRVTSSSSRVAAGMVLTLTVHDRLRVLKILDTGTRRGPASEAATLFEDMSPELPRQNAKSFAARPPAARPQGVGRPTKKERRQTDKLAGKSGIEPDIGT